MCEPILKGSLEIVMVLDTYIDGTAVLNAYAQHDHQLNAQFEYSYRHVCET
jgi:hypothetical protein